MLQGGTSTTTAGDGADIAVAVETATGTAGSAQMARIRRAVVDVGPLSAESKSDVRKADKVLGSHICLLVQASLAALELSQPPAYSDMTTEVLLRAWTLAETLRSDAVSPFHLIAALAAGHQKWADALAKLVKAEPAWLLVGSLVRPAVLDIIAGPHPVDRIVPTAALLEWISEAGSHARRERTEAAELQPDDLIEALVSRKANASVSKKVRRLLLQAARVGRAPSELVRTRHGVDNLNMTVGFFRSETTERFSNVREGLKSVGRDVTAVSQAVKGLSDGSAVMTTLESVGRALAASQSATLGRLEEVVGRADVNHGTLVSRLGALDERLANLPATATGADLSPVMTSLETLSETGKQQAASSRQQVDELAGKLVGLKDDTAAIRAQLPRPPSIGLLALAVLTILVVGGATGYLLSP